jgi:hypothetical protein
MFWRSHHQAYLNASSVGAALIFFVFLALRTTTLAADPSERAVEKAKFDKVAEAFRKHGVPATVIDEFKRYVIEISPEDLSRCHYPFCKLVRRIHAQAKTPLKIQITNKEYDGSQFNGATFDQLGNRRVITLSTALSLDTILNNRDSSLRHELQHFKMSLNNENHFMNGTFKLPPKGTVQHEYWNSFSVQEFYTYTDEARKGYRTGQWRDGNGLTLLGESFIMDLIEFIAEMRDSVKEDRVAFLDRRDLGSMDRSVQEWFNDPQSRAFTDGTDRLQVVMVQNQSVNFKGKYMITFRNPKGASYTFHSNFPYSEIKWQMPEMFQHVNQAAKVWFRATVGRQPGVAFPGHTRREWTDMTEIFKADGDRFKFRPFSKAKCVIEKVRLATARSKTAQPSKP